MASLWKGRVARIGVSYGNMMGLDLEAVSVDVRILKFTFVTNLLKMHVLLVRVLLRLS